MSLRPYIHELLAGTTTHWTTFFFFNFDFDLLFFCIVLVFLCSTQSKFKSPKKKITTQRQRGQTPGSHLSLKLFNLFPDGELEVEVEEEEKKKQRLFDSDLKTFTIFQA